MIANFLKYITIRLFLGFFLFLTTGYFFMYMLYEQLGAEKYGFFVWFLISLFSFIIPSIVLSYMGKLRFDGFIMKTSGNDLSLNSLKAVKRFERLLSFAHSFYFFPTTTEKLISRVYHQYSKLYLGLHNRYKPAQEVYEETLLRFPDNINLQNILLGIYSEQDNLTEKELKICSLIFYHSHYQRPAIEILSKHYIKNNVFDFDSQEIYAGAIKLNIFSKEKVVDFLVLKLIELNRLDDFAAEVYLTAYSDYANYSDIVMDAIIKLAKERKSKDRTDEISQKIFSVYEKIPEAIKKQLEEKILEFQHKEEIKAVYSVRKNHIKELISRLVQSIYEFIKVGRAFLMDRFNRLLAFKFPEISSVKNFTFVIFSSFIVLIILSLTILMLPQKESTLQTLNLLKIKPQYTLYESKLPYSIQVAAFKSMSRAEKAISELSDHVKNKAYFTKTSGNTIWYRVRLGEFENKKEAKQYAEKLLQKKQIKGYFITNFEPGFVKIK